MIAILGARGYVGTEFVQHCIGTGLSFTAISRTQCDYYQPSLLANCLRSIRATFLINCAGYTGKPNVDACEDDRTACLMANAVLPGLIADACEKVGIAWGHVSSGCVYTGMHWDDRGFTEDDPPNFTFRQNNCSFYAGCKALGEECLAPASDCYIWRLRIPFNQVDSPRNYLSKLMRYERLLDVRNSLSHINHFVTACMDCWRKGCEYGIYNLTNTGSVTTRQIAQRIQHYGLADKEFQFFESEQEFMRLVARTPRSNTVLDNSKAIRAGLVLPQVEEAIDESLQQWQAFAPAPFKSPF